MVPTLQAEGVSARNLAGVVYTASQVATMSDQAVYESSFQNFGFYAQARYWVFYEDSAVNCEGQGGCLFYTSSSDGASWVTPKNVGVHVADSDWSVVTNASYVFYARYNETSFGSTCNGSLLFGIGTAGANGTIVWQPERVVRAPDAVVGNA